MMYDGNMGYNCKEFLTSTVTPAMQIKASSVT
uniref:Uncharacterized protein n=1 Tax=Setaria italica TaxID=4555 RepID=K3ZFX4_SETIT